jgi:hypothetical protein
MHAVLLATALAAGSGDGPEGATDGRTIEQVPPHTLLRAGMTRKDVRALLGREYANFLSTSPSIWFSEFAPEPDWLGQRFVVTVHWDLDPADKDRFGRVQRWKVFSPEP